MVFEKTYYVRHFDLLVNEYYDVWCNSRRIKRRN